MIFIFRPQTQYENLGDAFIAKNLMDILSKKGTIYIDDNGVPNDYLNIIMNSQCQKVSEIGIPFILLPFTLRLQGHKVQYVSKPGHLYGGTAALGGWGRIISMLFYFSLLKLFGVKILKTGVSIGPLEHGYRFYEVFFNKLATFTGVREMKSFSYLKEMKMRNITRVKDLAFYSFPYRKNICIEEREYLTFSFRTLETSKYKASESAKIIADTLIDLMLLIQERSKKKIKIALVTQVQRDHEFNKIISECLASKGYMVEKKLYYKINLESYSEIASLYSKSILVLSNRLHALLYGLNYGAFPIGVGDKNENFKVKYILEDTNLNNIFFDINVTVENRSLGKEILKAFEENEIENAYLTIQAEDDYILVE